MELADCAAPALGYAARHMLRLLAGLSAGKTRVGSYGLVKVLLLRNCVLVERVRQLAHRCPSPVKYCGHVQAMTVKPVMAEVVENRQLVRWVAVTSQGHHY